MADKMDPTKSTPNGRMALAETLMYCRSQANAMSWEQFAEFAKGRGLDLPVSQLKKTAPTPQYGTSPNPGILFALEVLGFSFPNGEKVTAYALTEVLLEIRKPDGALVTKRQINSRNGQIGS